MAASGAAAESSPYQETTKMFCPQCGNALPDDAVACPVCGRKLAASAAPTIPADIGGTPQTSGKAVASLILGIFSFTLFAAIPAIVLGHVALSQIKKSAGGLQGKGVAIAGLVLGYLGVLILPLVLILAAIAIPNLLRARIVANEASAISEIHHLNVAEISYASSHAGFTCSLSDLSAAGLISPRLARGQENGYIFMLQECAAQSPGGPNTQYQVVAFPLHRNQTGMRTFCSDQSANVKADTTDDPLACLENGSPL